MSDNTGLNEQAPIGLQIRALRAARGWTLAELARRAGTSAPTLHRYEGGWDRFELATLRRLAAALGAQLCVRLVPGREPESEPSKAELTRLLEPLFWDRPLRPQDLHEYPGWVLRRVLMFGNQSQVEASRRFFGDHAVRTAVEHREVDARTRGYWKVILGSNDNDAESPQS